MDGLVESKICCTNSALSIVVETVLYFKNGVGRGAGPAGSVQGGQGGEDDATVGSGMTDVGSDCQQQPGGLDEEELAEDFQHSAAWVQLQAEGVAGEKVC